MISGDWIGLIRLSNGGAASLTVSGAGAAARGAGPTAPANRPALNSGLLGLIAGLRGLGQKVACQVPSGGNCV